MHRIQNPLAEIVTKELFSLMILIFNEKSNLNSISIRFWEKVLIFRYVSNDEAEHFSQ